MPWAASSVLLLLTVCRTPADAQETPSAVTGISPRVSRAVAESLAYLATQQHEDGAWSSGGYTHHVGVTGLSVMAMMAGGHLPYEGRYAHHVSKGIQFILDHTQRDGYITSEESNMYGHGFAAMCLAEAYGMAPRFPQLGEKLRDAVRLIVRSQKVDGGWRYTPIRSEYSDISVTVSQVQALRAARNAGIKVPKETIDKAMDYVRQSANPDGSFRYMLESSHTSLALTGGGVTALLGAGDYSSATLRKGLDYLRNYARFDFRRSGDHYYYAHYYCAQAMYQAGKADWDLWYPKIRDDLLQKQEPGGMWKGDQAGDIFSTAMAAMILQIPNEYLPIFQR